MHLYTYTYIYTNIYIYTYICMHFRKLASLFLSKWDIAPHAVLELAVSRGPISPERWHHFPSDPELRRRCPTRKLKEKDELAEDKSAGTPCLERRLVRSLCPASTPSQSVRGLWGQLVISFPPDTEWSSGKINLFPGFCHLTWKHNYK